jgi:hypothetical protein
MGFLQNTREKSLFHGKIVRKVNLVIETRGKLVEEKN